MEKMQDFPSKIRDCQILKLTFNKYPPTITRSGKGKYGILLCNVVG